MKQTLEYVHKISAPIRASYKTGNDRLPEMLRRIDATSTCSVHWDHAPLGIQITAHIENYMSPTLRITFERTCLLSQHSNALAELVGAVDGNLSRPRLDCMLDNLEHFLRFEDRSITLDADEREQLDETIKTTLKNILRETLSRVIENAIEHTSKHNSA